MKLNVRVIPNSSRNSIEQLEDESYKVKLTTAPVDGKANKALVNFLAKHFGVRKSAVDILKGHTGKNKIIEIITD